MSKYTTEVRYICEQAAGLKESGGFDDVDNIITTAIPKVFSFSFPIFDEGYRNVLERKILMHYYTREIGMETTGLWKLRMCIKLNEIMPYYNQLYRSELLTFNPLYTVNLDRTHHTKFDGTTTGTENIGDNKTLDKNVAVTNITDTVEKMTESGKEVLDGESESNGTESGNTMSTDRVEEKSKSCGNTASDNVSEVKGSGTSSGNTSNTRYYSDTPQGNLMPVALDTGMYLTNYTRDVGTSSDESNTTNKTTGNSSVVTDETASKTSTQVVQGQHSQTDHNKTTTDNTTTSERNRDTTGNIVFDGSTKEGYKENYSRDASTSGKIDNIEDYIEHIQGYEGKSASQLLQEFRETFLNIDMMIINDLEELFMGVW